MSARMSTHIIWVPCAGTTRAPTPSSAALMPSYVCVSRARLLWMYSSVHSGSLSRCSMFHWPAVPVPEIVDCFAAALSRSLLCEKIVPMRKPLMQKSLLKPPIMCTWSPRYRSSCGARLCMKAATDVIVSPVNMLFPKISSLTTCIPLALAQSIHMANTRSGRGRPTGFMGLHKRSTRGAVPLVSHRSNASFSDCSVGSHSSLSSVMANSHVVPVRLAM
mmetsp:Transcript_8686/g.21737  ORF Transcript_8686/g.21737 Transcript_8686/m.21737 type:complete len:219 (-) Transcript_8686:250-906(-)